MSNLGFAWSGNLLSCKISGSLDVNTKKYILKSKKLKNKIIISNKFFLQRTMLSLIFQMEIRRSEVQSSLGPKK